MTRIVWQLCALSLLAVSAAAQDMNLNPTRPTIANSAAIQSRGVLQVETGYDAYPRNPPGNQQTLDTLFTYTPLARLRLDFDWSAFNHQQEDGVITDGVGTIQIAQRFCQPTVPALVHGPNMLLTPNPLPGHAESQLKWHVESWSWRASQVKFDPRKIMN